MRWMNLVLVAVAGALIGQQADATKNAVGRWAGESICTVPDSPCHDEHVIYHIARDKNDATKLRIQANKTVNRKEEYMGDLLCSVNASADHLSCSANIPKKNDWEFQISGATMTGTLTLGEEKTLYRRVRVTRQTGP